MLKEFIRKKSFFEFFTIYNNEIGMKNEIINKNLDIEYRFEALFS